MEDYTGWLIFGGVFAAFALIGWVSEKVSERNRAEKQRQRNEIAESVLTESGITETNHNEVSQNFEYVVNNLFRKSAETEEYEIITPTPPSRRQGMLCPKCEMGYLVRRQGKYGTFLGCSRYPQCNSTKAVGWTNKKAKEAQKNQYSKEFLKDLEKAYK